MSDEASRGPDSFDVRQEDDEISTRLLATTAVIGVAVGAVGVFFAGALLAAETGRLRPTAAGPLGQTAASRTIANIEQTPVLDTKVGLDLRARQSRELEMWRWVDRDGGIASLPIEVAIDIIVSEGAR
ncbi:MAG: hypothetical protein ABSC94_02195 [Polyangiaceae bacterium]|jgi:hypothetical protein